MESNDAALGKANRWEGRKGFGSREGGRLRRWCTEEQDKSEPTMHDPVMAGLTKANLRTVSSQL